MSGRVTGRADIERCNAHIASLAETLNLDQAANPQAAFLQHVRSINRKYPNLGEPQPVPQGVRFHQDDLNGIPAVWAVARGASTHHRILYLHGGGWVTGSTDIYHWIAGTLSRMSKSSVLMVDYRLAPEQPFPAGLQDCVDAYRWVTERGPNRERAIARSIAVVGDSAGANLALASVLHAASENDRLPNCIVAIGGVFDLRPGVFDSTSRTNTDADPWKMVRDLYLLPNQTPDDPLVSPQAATMASLGQLPPVLLQFSSAELVAYSNRAFAQQLDKAGVRLTVSVWPNLPHVWHLFPSVLPEATGAIQEIGQYISRMRAEPVMRDRVRFEVS